MASIDAPAYERHVLSLDDADLLIKAKCGNDVAAAYHHLRPLAFKADLLRYCLLWATGGVWVDDDLHFEVPLDSLIPHQSSYDLLAPMDRFWNCHSGTLNGFLAAVPRSPIFRCAMDAIVSNVRFRRYLYHGREMTLHITGPALLYDCTCNQSVLYKWDWRPPKIVSRKGSVSVITHKAVKRPRGQPYNTHAKKHTAFIT
jgi:mannosyltransferase OCH1-like enzyme